MDAVDQFAPTKAVSATRSLESAHRALFRQLSRLYAAERQLAFDLPRYFRQCTELSLRLVLSDERKETSRQLVRLDLIIDTAGRGALSRAARPRHRAEVPVDAHSDDDFARGAPLSHIAAELLRQGRAAIAEYQSAIASAKRLGLLAMADLLEQSLTEKQDATAVLSRLAAEP